MKLGAIEPASAERSFAGFESLWLGRLTRETRMLPSGVRAGLISNVRTSDRT
jgi:hypothetical protein